MLMKEGKKAGIAILVSNKIDIKTKATVRDKGHYIIIKGMIQQEDITAVKNYAPNIRAPEHVKQILLDIKGRDGQKQRHSRRL